MISFLICAFLLCTTIIATDPRIAVYEIDTEYLSVMQEQCISNKVDFDESLCRYVLKGQISISNAVDEIIATCDTSMFKSFLTAKTLFPDESFEVMLNAFSRMGCVEIIHLYVDRIYSNGLPNIIDNIEDSLGNAIIVAWNYGQKDIVDILAQIPERKWSAVMLSCKLHGNANLIKHLGVFPTFEMLKMAVENEKVNIISEFAKSCSESELNELLRVAIYNDCGRSFGVLLSLNQDLLVSSETIVNAVVSRNENFLRLLLLCRHGSLLKPAAVAAAFGNTGFYELLVAHGADHRVGLGPAAISGNSEMMSFLLSKYEFPQTIIDDALKRFPSVKFE